MKKMGIGAFAALLLAGISLYFQGGSPPVAAAPEGGAVAVRERPAPQQGDQLDVTGVVTRILADDRDGSRHQRFIIQVDGGNTLLIAHNIDLAPRLEGLSVGEKVRVFGEFAWNPRGGTLHWTHHDPQGRHVPGYIEWRGRRYQ